MQMSMLLTEQLKPVPDDIKIAMNFGYESCILDDGTIAAQGEVVAVTATKESFVKWLAGKDIWVGNGMMGFKKEKVVAF